MDVRCGRCGTEYEFDDALVSDRGTSVKCTNCGHQFKVHPAGKRAGAPERWVVRTVHGRELVYTSLRDLQKGIAQRQVGPDDLLSRAGHAPRPLSSIAELEPFFRSKSGVAPKQVQGTLMGVAPPPEGTARPPSEPERMFPSAASEPEPPTLPRNAPPEPEPAPEPAPDPVPAPATEKVPQTEQAPPPDVRNEVVGAAPTDDVVIRDRQTHPMTPTPSDVRESYRSYDDIHTDPRFVSGPPPSRRAKSRWIVGVVLVGAIALFGATVGRQYLEKYVTKTTEEKPETDPRVAEMLKQGNTALYDGDFEGAKEQFDKATMLAERHPEVLAALARLASAKADVYWLELRLLDPNDEELVQTTHRLLAERARKADLAAKKAEEVAPADPTVVRARIDALRLRGEVDRARKMVDELPGDKTEPETAYVLAALDLAEKEPVWSSVVDRLRIASEGERDLGRARGALVYALARSGEVDAAKAELAKIEANERPHPILNELRDFVRRHASALTDAGGDAAVEVATVDPSSLPIIGPGEDLGAGDDGDGTFVGGGDFRAKLKQAAAALKAGELETAESLYRAVLADQAGNTEALAGLGDVARARKDPGAAQEHYDRVLEKNPNYLPALIAKADAKWDAGDRAGALALYRRVLSSAGAGSDYGQRAAARIAQAEKEPATAPPAAAPPETAPDEPEDEPPSSPPPAAEEPPESAPDQPHIDTTDLPGFE